VFSPPAQYAWNILTTQELLALPMFIVMGEILFRTRLSQSLFRGLSPWAALLPGRLLHVNVIGFSVFAASPGSSPAPPQRGGFTLCRAVRDRAVRSDPPRHGTCPPGFSGAGPCNCFSPGWRVPRKAVAVLASFIGVMFIHLALAMFCNHVLPHAENEKLGSYGWVDKEGGVTRIPIDRAMDVMLQRGFPARADGGNALNVVTQDSSAGRTMVPR